MARTPSRPAALDAVDALLAAGWLADGATPTETVRMGTSASPVYGGSGGELRVFGGRQRFVRPGGDLRCTVGRSSVSFYHVRDGQACAFRNYSTGRDIAYIRQAALAAATADMPDTPQDVAARAAAERQRDRDAAQRAENERVFRERLLAGERVLSGGGTKGQSFWRKEGLVVVLYADPETEIPVCCGARATWLAHPTIRGVCPARADEHSPGCTGAQAQHPCLSGSVPDEPRGP
jgi:hypothetical protein